MSFGFSVSDIYGCARLAYLLYDEFKQAPGACQEFAHELLLFHQVLWKTKSYFDCEIRHLNHSDQAALSLCFESCKELLYVQIMGAPTVPKDLENLNLGTLNRQTSFYFHPSTASTDRDQFRFLRGLRHKFGERKFAQRIPKLQRAVSAHVEKLTALNVLIIQSSQVGIEASQERIEERVGETHDLLIKSSEDRALQLDSLSDRLDDSQARIEAQLQAILETQQRSKAPILSHSLDASSPEGRETWMEMGRLFRDEGITPAMIQKNRGLLVNAMKTILNNNESDLAESIPRSYATAPEYPVDNSITSSVTHPRNASRLDLPSVSSPLSLLGSAPPQSAGFTDAFLERQHGATSSLDQIQNVDDGMQSLLRGMSSKQLSVYTEDDSEYIISEDIELGNVELEDVELENVDLKHVEQGLPNHSRERRGTMDFTPNFPARPAFEPKNSTAKLEDEDRGVTFGASIQNAVETIRSPVLEADKRVQRGRSYPAERHTIVHTHRLTGAWKNNW